MTSPWDPYLDLRTGVLRNVLGIDDPATLQTAETAIVAARVTLAAEHPVAETFDLAHLQALHRFLFGPIYPWAGELRTVALGKGGTVFCPPAEIAPRAGRLFLGLAARDHLRGLDRLAFLEPLTEFLAALTFLHPFREGNGRTQRAFVAQLARAAGHRLDFSSLGRAENLDAARAAHTGDLAPLRILLDRLLIG